MTDSAMIAAQQRMEMRSMAEARMALEGQQNAGGQRRLDDNGKPYYDAAPISQYPRMLYRRTDVEQTQPLADALSEVREPPMVINRFGGLLCDTVIAASPDDAETLAADGWELSPQAAYGQVSGLGEATSAKDAEIAALRAALAEANGDPEAKRGPGRPRKEG